MASRLTAFLLMLVLVCAGIFGGPFGPAAPPSALALEKVDAVAVAAPVDERSSNPAPGDPTAQSPVETVHDLPALITASAPSPLSVLPMAAPLPAAEHARLAPYLDGPRRPPRATPHLA